MKNSSEHLRPIKPHTQPNWVKFVLIALLFSFTFFLSNYYFNPPYNIQSISVEGVNGIPITNTSVNLEFFGNLPWQVYLTAQTDQYGVAKFDSVPTGNYSVLISAPTGYESYQGSQSTNPALFWPIFLRKNN